MSSKEIRRPTKLVIRDEIAEKRQDKTIDERISWCKEEESKIKGCSAKKRERDKEKSNENQYGEGKAKRKKGEISLEQKKKAVFAVYKNTSKKVKSPVSDERKKKAIFSVYKDNKNLHVKSSNSLFNHFFLNI